MRSAAGRSTPAGAARLWHCPACGRALDARCRRVLFTRCCSVRLKARPTAWLPALLSAWSAAERAVRSPMTLAADRIGPPESHRLHRGALACAVLASAAGLVARPAAAFPLSDVTNPSVVAPASAASPDLSDASALAHQLQLLGPYGSIVAPGWSFSPSLSLQEAFNDNVFQTETDRRWDLITYVTPGIAVYGDTQNVQLRLNYQPTVEYYMRNSSLNQLAQNLDATADITLWRDHLYLDLRAFAGVGSASGTLPGLGYGGVASTPGAPNPGLAGLTKQNSTQYASFAASPYFLQQFGPYGNLKVGYTLEYSSSSNNAGLSPLPLGTTGPSSAETTNQEIAQYTSGVFLERMTDTALINASQTQGTGATVPRSYNNTASNQLNYVVNRAILAFASIGYEDIDYSGNNALAIHDITWQVGTTLTPNPRSSLTMSYGHQQGANSAALNGYYALTARTSISASYNQQLGTQLQAISQQLAAGDVNNSGTLVNSRTGQPIFIGNNLLGSQSQLYRSSTATIGTTTQLDRDTITFNAQYSSYTAVGEGATGTTSGVTWTANWIHAISDNLLLSSSASYGTRAFTDPGGHNAYLALSGSLRYIISATLSSSLSYAFYDLRSTQQGQSLYQDVVILSLTKQF